MTDSSMLKYQYDTILDQLILLQLHAESPDCPCSLQGTHPGELGEFCEPKHLRSIVALARETIAMEEDEARLDYLENLVLEGSELLGKMENKLCDREVDLGDYVTWSREKRKPLEEWCYSGFCNIVTADEALVEEIAEMFRKKAEPRWCFPVKETDKELSKLSRTLGTAKRRITEIQRHLEVPLNICRGQAEMFESTTGVLDPYGSRCRDPKTGQWMYSEECGFEPAGITTTALGMDGITRYEFEFKIVSLDKLIVSHDPFTFTPNPNYPEELQPRLRERAATKIQVEKIAANLEPDAVITDFHVIDRGTPIVGPDSIVEAGNGRVMGIIKAAADYPDKYAHYKDRLREKAHDYGLSPKDVDSIETPVLIRVRITDVDRTLFTQEANQAATIAPSAIENARTDALKITMGMLQELIVGENESLEDALRAPKNQAFAKRFLATLPENVQAALVDAQGYLNRDGVHRMAMAIFVSAFQGDAGLRLAEKAFESVDMDVRNTVNAIARSLGPLAQAEALTRTGERETVLSIGDDLAQTINVYSAIKRNPALTVEKYLAQEQIFARELTSFQEGILVVLEEYKRSPRKLANIFTAYAEGVIKAPPPAQAALFPGAEVTKEGLWESAVKAPEAQPALMEIARMFREVKVQGKPFYGRTDISGGGIFTLYKNSKVIGHATIAFHHKDTTYPLSGFVPAKTAVLDSMEINEEERGKGYGGKFIGELEKISKKQGMETIYLTSVMGESEEFWQKKGYQYSGQKRIWVKTLVTLSELDDIAELSMPAPFGWVGGKKQLSKRIVLLIPSHKTYVEPFCGAAWVFWAKEPSEVEVLNDLDPDLMRFYRDIGSIERCNISELSRDWAGLKARDGKLEPCSFLAEVLCSYGSIRGVRDFVGSHHKVCDTNAPTFHNYLPQYQARLKDTKLYNEDWQKVALQYDSPDTFFYFDPPYHSTSRRYAYSEDQLAELAIALPDLKGKWLLSYEDHPDVRQAFKGFHILPVVSTYTLGSKFDSNKTNGKQLLIANYPIEGKLNEGGERKVAMEMIGGIEQVAGLSDISRWKGPAYRAESGYRHDPGQTAGDVVRYEQEELGNDLGVGKDKLKYLDRFPANAIKWVSKSKKVAAHYNGASPVDVEDHIIIAEDGDGGYLVLDPDREIKLAAGLSEIARMMEVPRMMESGRIEAIADDQVLPVMKEYPGDRLTSSEIKRLGKLKVSDNTIIEALNYLEESGEVISFPATPEKPKRWAAPNLEEVNPCKEINLMLKGQPWGAESMLAWAERLKVQADRAEGCRSLQEAAYTKAYEVIKIAQPMLKPVGVAEVAEVARLFAPMKLLTKEIRGKLPPLYSQEKVEDPLVQVKFFTPDSNWTWYGIEFDGDDTFYGWVVGFEKELGYFSLRELESARGPLGLAIERDKWFSPMPLSEVKKLHAHERGEMGQTRRHYFCDWMDHHPHREIVQVLSDEEDPKCPYCKRVMTYGVFWGPAQAKAKLAQGTVAAIGSAAITGIGIGAGFKFVDWLAKTFSKKELNEEEGARRIPAYIDVFKTTIAKHYRSPEDFHEGSIRVVKPEEGILVYLGCLKSDDWDGERCSSNPTVVKTIVPDTKKYRDELEHLKLVHPEVKINYQAEEVGVEPVLSQDEQEELKAVGKALEKAEVRD